MQFGWNDDKAASNLSKHEVSFEEAKTVFDDPLYVDFYDPDHSENENRYLIVGESDRGRLLIVHIPKEEIQFASLAQEK